MKSMIRYGMVVVLFISVNVLAQKDMSKLKSTFQNLENEWSKYYIAGDADKLANMYTEDAYSLPSNLPMWKGREEIRMGNKKDMESGTKYTSLTAKTLDVFGSGDLVYEVGTYSLTFIPQNMTEATTENGKYIDIWQKQADGTWKIKADTWNSNENPESTTQAGAKEKVNYNKDIKDYDYKNKGHKDIDEDDVMDNNK